MPLLLPDLMGWDEALRLTVELLKDPSSHVSAAVQQWSYPVSREALAGAAVFNIYGGSQYGRKHKPYPMPWDDKGERRGTAVSRERWTQIRTELEAG